MTKYYWQFTYIDPKKYQMIPQYHYLPIATYPCQEYDTNAFKEDYKNSSYPQDKYFQVRNIEIVDDKYFT